MNAQTKKPERRPKLPVVLLAIFILAIVSWALPLPSLKAQSSYTYKSRPQAVSLAWPSYGQAAIGAETYGLLDTNGAQVPVSMASLAKVVTAMAVLQKKPLKAGNQGPTITITSTDVNSYNDYAANDGSVVKVAQGEQLSEYQALQAMLIPSANNMADTLARWAFGSDANYVTYANTYVKSLGLKSTTLADTNGFTDQSLSTATDMTTLGLAFMNNPVLRDIVSQQTAELPVAGTVHNTNWLLGIDGIVGIKTGNTDKAGGCYLFASQRSIEGQKILVVGAILGAPDLQTSIGDSRALLASVDKGFTKVTVAKKNEILGIYVAAWGNVVNLVSKDDVSLVTWQTRQVVSSVKIDTNKVTVTKAQPVGTVAATAWGNKSTGPIVTGDQITGPSWQWRLYRRHI